MIPVNPVFAEVERSFQAELLTMDMSTTVKSNLELLKHAACTSITYRNLLSCFPCFPVPFSVKGHSLMVSLFIYRKLDLNKAPITESGVCNRASPPNLITFIY